MLEAFKGKLHSVQLDVSSGIQKLKQRKSPSLYKLSSSGASTSALSSSVSSPCFIEPDAGSEILEHYRHKWRDTHELSEQNIRAADQCSSGLVELQRKCRHTANAYLHLHREVGALPQLAEGLSDLVADTANLQGLCEEVETALAYLEVICDTQEFQERKLDAKFNLALYREQKMAELNERKAEMTMHFLNRIETKAKDRALEQVEKQRLYQHAFEQDLSLYKATGLIANTLPPLDDGGATDNSSSSSKMDKSVRDLPLLAELIESSQIRGAQGLLAQVLIEKMNRSQNVKAARRSKEETDWTAVPVDERDANALEFFLADVKLEDSGIAGSDCQSVNGETDQDSPTVDLEIN